MFSFKATRGLFPLPSIAILKGREKCFISIFSSILVLLPYCNLYSSMDKEKQDTTPVKTPQNTYAVRGGSEIVIQSIEIFAWWWSENQLKVGIDEQNPPPKKSYVKLEQWKDTKRTDVPHPDHIDIICQIKNTRSTATNVNVKFTSDYLVAPVNYPCTGNLDKITDNIGWSGEVFIGQKSVHNLASGERRKVKIKNFNLRDILEKFSGDKKSDYLWLWKLRIHTYIKKPNGKYTQNQVILSLNPKDRACDN